MPLNEELKEVVELFMDVMIENGFVPTVVLSTKSTEGIILPGTTMAALSHEEFTEKTAKELEKLGPLSVTAIVASQCSYQDGFNYREFLALLYKVFENRLEPVE